MSDREWEALQFIKEGVANLNEGMKKLLMNRGKRKPQAKTIIDEWFEEQWGNYPKKEGKKKALSHFKASVKTEEDLARFKIALDNYKALLLTESWRAPQSGSTFFNNWEDYIELDTQSPQEQLDKWVKELQG